MNNLAPMKNCPGWGGGGGGVQGNLNWMPGVSIIHQSFKKNSSYYLDRELHTRRIVSTVMM